MSLSFSFRPRSHAERDAIIVGINRYRGSAHPRASILALDEALFKDRREAFIEVRERWNARCGAAREQARQAAVADQHFDRDLRNFAASVRDEAGHATPRVVSELLGGMLPSTVVSRPHREEIQRATVLLDRLPHRVGLRYDRSCAEALRVSTRALDDAATVSEAAQRALLGAGVALAEARSAFDHGYMRLFRASKAMLDELELLTIFPRFARARPADDGVTAPIPVVSSDAAPDLPA